MSNLTDRVSYIKGLAEGMKLDTESNEGKIIEKMLEKEGKEAPKFVMDKSVTDFYQFTRDSFSLEGYDPHPFDDKIPVAI